MPTEETSLEVPGEPGVYWCARHRNVKVRLRCGRCEKPICPKCTVMGPTGARCRECASNRTAHIYQIQPLHFVTTFIASLMLGAVGAVVAPLLGFFLLFFAPLAGTALGRALTFVTRGKRGAPLAITASVGATIGTLAVPTLSFAAAMGEPQGLPLEAVAATMLPQFGYILLYLIVVISAIWYWIK